MVPVISGEQWRQRLAETPRPNAKNILAFYEHRIGAICTDATCLLAPLDDHLVHRGDGVFETIRISGWKIFNLDAHLQRLERSAGGLLITPPCSWADIREIVLAVARAAHTAEGNLRVLLGRGPGGFGIDPAECPEASLYVIAYGGGGHDEAWYARGLTAKRSETPVRPSMLAKLKTANYLPGVLMSLEATRKGVDLTFSFDADGNLAEAAIANVAIVDKDGILTIPEFRNALKGTTIRKAAELAASFMPVATRPVPEAELFTAKEILVLGTAHECVGVVRYEDHTIGDGKPGPVAIRLRKLIHDDMFSHGEPLRDDA